MHYRIINNLHLIDISFDVTMPDGTIAEIVMSPGDSIEPVSENAMEVIKATDVYQCLKIEEVKAKLDWKEVGF